MVHLMINPGLIDFLKTILSTFRIFVKNTFMRTIQLKINDKVYDKFIWLLSKFSKDEVEIVSDNVDYTANREYLQRELDEINEGKAKFLSQSEFERR